MPRTDPAHGLLGLAFAAPHRLGFLAGSLNLAGLAAWWLVQLAGLHFDTPLPPAGTLPPSLLHGPAMLFLVFPPFVFGFLLTVFPRWMGYPDLEAHQFGPVHALQLIGGLTVQSGLWSGHDGLILAGFLVIALGWILALAVLAPVERRSRADGKPVAWHAVSTLAALLAGLIALGLTAAFLGSGNADLRMAGNRVAIALFVMPVFLTVTHRMVPFFAGSVVAGYERWRPDWLLAALGALLLARLTGELAARASLAAAADLGLAGLTGAMAWKWWPRGAAPGLLRVLLWGFVWAPIGFALAALSTSGVELGKAPDHALLLGFAASLLVAMVTRVTQGHSGRPLEMPRAVWLAFGAVQLAALLRLAAGIKGEDSTLLVLGAAMFLGGILPWAVRHAAIYLSPREDGRAG